MTTPTIDRRASTLPDQPITPPDPAQVLVSRIAREGWKAEDFGQVRTNHLILQPVQGVARTASGIHLSGSTTEVHGLAALAYKVMVIGPLTADVDQLVADLTVGDIISVRNAMLDGLSEKNDVAVIEARHVLAKLNVGV